MGRRRAAMQREQLVQMPLGWGVLGYAIGREQTVWLGHMEEREGSWKGAGSQDAVTQV